MQTDCILRVLFLTDPCNILTERKKSSDVPEYCRAAAKMP